MVLAGYSASSGQHQNLRIATRVMGNGVEGGIGPSGDDLKLLHHHTLQHLACIDLLDMFRAEVFAA